MRTINRSTAIALALIVTACASTYQQEAAPNAATDWPANVIPHADGTQTATGRSKEGANTAQQYALLFARAACQSEGATPAIISTELLINGTSNKTAQAAETGLEIAAAIYSNNVGWGYNPGPDTYEHRATYRCNPAQTTAKN